MEKKKPRHKLIEDFEKIIGEIRAFKYITGEGMGILRKEIREIMGEKRIIDTLIKRIRERPMISDIIRPGERIRKRLFK